MRQAVRRDIDEQGSEPSRGILTLSGVRGSVDTQRWFDEIRSVVGMIQSSGTAFRFIYRKAARGFRELGHNDKQEWLLL